MARFMRRLLALRKKQSECHQDSWPLCLGALLSKAQEPIANSRYTFDGETVNFRRQMAANQRNGV